MRTAESGVAEARATNHAIAGGCSLAVSLMPYLACLRAIVVPLRNITGNAARPFDKACAGAPVAPAIGSGLASNAASQQRITAAARAFENIQSAGRVAPLSLRVSLGRGIWGRAGQNRRRPSRRDPKRSSRSDSHRGTLASAELLSHQGELFLLGRVSPGAATGPRITSGKGARWARRQGAVVLELRRPRVSRGFARPNSRSREARSNCWGSVYKPLTT